MKKFMSAITAGAASALRSSHRGAFYRFEFQKMQYNTATAAICELSSVREHYAESATNIFSARNNRKEYYIYIVHKHKRAARRRDFVGMHKTWVPFL